MIFVLLEILSSLNVFHFLDKEGQILGFGFLRRMGIFLLKVVIGGYKVNVLMEVGAFGGVYGL